MLKIAICTNRVEFKNYTEDVLKGILCEYEEWRIEEVTVQAMLEKKHNKILDYHIFCLDEQLLEKQGIEPIAFISRVRPDATFILLEGVAEKGIAGMRYHLFAYQIQRIKQQDLRMELDRQWKRANSISHNLDILIDGETVSIPMEQIMYIESSNRRVVLHTTLGNYEYYEKMYVLEVLLKEDFIRCHQSYIVSKRFVTDYNSVEIKLDEIVIPVGRKYKEQVYNAFHASPTSFIDVRKDKIVSERQGVLVCERGLYKGSTLYFRPEQSILVGRDEKVADIVVNLPKVSRLHCVIIFHEQDNFYEIVDFSKNGTYLSGQQRLVPDTTYLVKPGTQISFGELDHVYRLG